jgi:hypothetical protein
MSKKERLGDSPIEQRYHAEMNHMAAALDRYFNGEDRSQPRKTGFVLMVFEYGETEGRCNFISNGADRADVVVLFKEMIARFEGQPDVQGRA